MIGTLPICPIGYPLAGGGGSSDSDAPDWAGGVSGLSAVDAGTSKEVTLSWNAATDAGNGLDGYAIYYSTVQANVFTAGIRMVVPAGTTTVKVGGLTDGTTYYFGVRARDKNVTPNYTTNTDTQSAVPTSGSLGYYNRINARVLTPVVRATVTLEP